jgi:hypothetical protein
METGLTLFRALPLVVSTQIIRSLV